MNKVKKAIHLGGAVQYLFGIRSNAGDNTIKLPGIMNEYWGILLQKKLPEE